MLSNNLSVYGTKVLFEVFWDIVYFPIWWYSGGFLAFAKKIWDFLSYEQKRLAFFLWIKNIYKPMYAQSDWQGVLISIFMRLVLLIFKAILMIFWLVLSLFMLLAWLIIPFVIIYFIYFQFF